MKFDNSHARRQDRLLPEPEAINLLKNGEYGYLSLVSEENKAYGIPISFVWNGVESIYFHCAPEGRKLRILSENDDVSFCVVGKTKVIPNQFTTEYQSIILSGKLKIVTEEKESMKALELLLDKYSPNDKTVGLKYSEKSYHRTRILRLDVEKWSGKQKKI